MLRYCTSHPSQMQKSEKIVGDPDARSRVIALHCFVNMGPVGEQGTRKKTQKRDVMRALDYWVLMKDWRKTYRGTIGTADGPIYGQRVESTSDSLLARIIDRAALDKAKKFWLLT